MGVLQVVKDTEEEHNVEGAHGLRGYIGDVNGQVLDLGAKRPPRQLEAVLPAPIRGEESDLAAASPAEPVRGQEAGHAAALALEGHGAGKGAISRNVFPESDSGRRRRLMKRGVSFEPLGLYPVAEVDRVVPLDCRRLTSDAFRRVGHASSLAGPLTRGRPVFSVDEL